VKVILALLLVAAVPLHARQAPDPRLRRLEQLKAIAPTARTEAQAVEAAQLFLSVLLDHLVEILPDSERTKVAGLYAVIIPVDGSSPVSIRGKEIRISSEYPGTVALLATLLAHDLAVTRLEPFDTSNPLLEHPLAASALVPLMTPLRNYLESPFVLDHWNMLSCPPGNRDCQYLEGESLTVLFSFVFCHEIGHRIRGDEHGHSLEEEMAADAIAWPLVQKLLAGFRVGETSFDEMARLVLLAGPILSLQYELFDSEGQEVSWIARRRDALISRIPEDLREEVVELIVPQRSTENVRRLELRWDQAPQRLWIDGVEIPPAEVNGRALLVGGGPHQVLAWSAEGMAYDSVQAGGSRSEVHLRFRRVAESPAPLEGLKTLQRERRWFDLLLQTSDAALKPRDNSLVMLYADCLRHMNLTDLVEVPVDGIVTPKEKRNLRSWKRSGMPLSSWW
jgi:hypothetical protein